MSAGLRPRRLAGAFVALVGVLSLAACSLPGVNATPDAAAILKNVQAVQINDATFTFSYSGQLSADASNFLLTNTTIDLTNKAISGNGNGQFTASPQRAELAFILPVQVAGITPTLQLIDDSSTKTLYAGSNVLTLLSSATTASPGSRFPSASSAASTSRPSSTSPNCLDVSLVGSETLNGVSVYHLKGTESGTVSAAY